MRSTHGASVAAMLDRWRLGDAAAGDALLCHVYEELRRLARAAMRNERIDHTLEPTALVHEAWARVLGAGPLPAVDRDHMLALAVRMMRQVLVNHSHARRAAKRGGAWRRRTLDEVLDLHEARCGDLVALDEALAELAEVEPRQAQLVELRFFGGLTMAAAAQLLDVPLRRAERDWAQAREWLRDALAP